MAVLVVDDSISVRRGVARQLRGLGLEVHEVSDGLEALGRLRDSHYGLVLTDLEMPKLDGFALLAEIKRSAEPVDDPRDRGQYPVRPGNPAARAGARGRGPAFQAGRSLGAGAGRRATPGRRQGMKAIETDSGAELRWINR